MAGLLTLEAIYLLGVGPLRQRFQWATKVEKRQVVLFTLGILTIFIALEGPIHDLAEKYLFTMHMMQHLLLIYLMPPLLLFGIPTWLMRRLFPTGRIAILGRFFTHPITAFVLFNVVLVMWHFPVMYNLTLENHSIHIFQHITFMVTGVIMWWPLLSPLPEVPRPSYPIQTLYLFFQSLPMGFVGAVIVFANDVLYTFYETAPRVWGISPLTDQQIGGAIMKTASIVFLVVFIVVFLRWFTSEEKKSEVNG